MTANETQTAGASIEPVPTGLPDEGQRLLYVAKMRAKGQRFAWNWPATFLMGFWALHHGLYWTFFKKLWSDKWTWIVLIGSIIMAWPGLDGSEAEALLVVFGYVGLWCGRYANEMLFIEKGVVPAKEMVALRGATLFVAAYLLLIAIAGLGFIVSSRTLFPVADPMSLVLYRVLWWSSPALPSSVFATLVQGVGLVSPLVLAIVLLAGDRRKKPQLILGANRVA